MKLIGIGNTAKVYEMEDNKVLKLFHSWNTKEAIEYEQHCSKVIQAFDFLKPKVYELVKVDGQLGLIYDKIEGTSLLDWVLHNGDTEKCASYMANLHNHILKNQVQDIPDYKDVLRRYLLIATAEDLVLQENLLYKLAKLEDGDNLCHGDFHPGNIMLTQEGCYVIDFVNICRGPRIYDISRTAFLMEQTPIPGNPIEIESIQKLRKALTDDYLKKMDTSREEIQDYIEMIKAVRKVECPI